MVFPVTRRAQELDPLSLIIGSNLGRVLYFAREYDQAISQLKRTLEMDPNFWGAHYKLSMPYDAKGQYEEGLAEREESLVLEGDPQLASALKAGYSHAGYRGAMTQWRAQLTERSKHADISPYAFAMADTPLGEKEQAFQWLDRSHQ